MERWFGRVALITGASVGIGADIAQRLVQQGMKVVGCSRNIEKIEVRSYADLGKLYALYPILILQAARLLKFCSHMSRHMYVVPVPYTFAFAFHLLWKAVSLNMFIIHSLIPCPTVKPSLLKARDSVKVGR